MKNMKIQLGTKLKSLAAKEKVNECMSRWIMFPHIEGGCIQNREESDQQGKDTRPQQTKLTMFKYS